LPEILRM